jgi:GNAT superfamily N-acetyltransferase
MNLAKIIPFQTNHATNLAALFPEDWHFDFEKFIEIHSQNLYFKAFTLQADNQIIGFGNLFLFDNTAWLGNIVVGDRHRGKGCGSLITQHLIETAKANGVTTQNLIATPLGQPVYKKLGFKVDLNYDFYVTKKEQFNFKIHQTIRKAIDSDFEEILKLDFQITGENRKEMLQFYLPDTYLFFEGGAITGIFINALETGSVIAQNQKAGIELLKLKLNFGNTKIIIPENNVLLKEFLSENGYEKALSLPKMQLGESYPWKPQNIFNRGAGYCG